jgi:multicomponent Na+:H+ antiporter subunit D
MNIDHGVLLPVLIPIASAVLGLLFLRGRHRALGLFSLLAILLSLASGGRLLANLARGADPAVLPIGGWPVPASIVYVADFLSATMTVLGQLVFALAIVYSLGCRDRCARDSAYYPLLLTLSAGLAGTFLSGDLFHLFVMIELVVISGAVLTARSDDPAGPEAAYKYFYMSTLAGILLLLASGCLYAAHGTLNMADLARRISAHPECPLGAAGMVFLLSAFLIKGAVVPFHFWQPDFHSAAPTAVSAALSSVVVKIGVYGFLRMTTLLFVPHAEILRSSLIVFGAAGLLYGGFAAAGTRHAKRMLAYSTLAQVGSILIAIGWGTIPAIAAAIVLIVNHALIKASLLMLAGAVASRSPEKSASFESIGGLGRSARAAGVLYFAGALALVGIPPTNGFIGKLVLFRGGVELGRFGTVALLAGAGIVTMIYMLRSFARVWWEGPQGGIEPKPRGDRLAAPAVLIVLCLALGLWAEPLLDLALRGSVYLSEPAAYIAAVLGGGS